MGAAPDAGTWCACGGVAACAAGGGGGGGGGGGAGASVTNAIIVGTSGSPPVKKSTGTTIAATSASCVDIESRRGTPGFDGMCRVWPVITSNMTASVRDVTPMCKSTARNSRIAFHEFTWESATYFVSGRTRSEFVRGGAESHARP
jgi:hypothetical protein